MYAKSIFREDGTTLSIQDERAKECNEKGDKSQEPRKDSKSK